MAQISMNQFEQMMAEAADKLARAQTINAELLEAADNFVRWIDTYGCTMDENMLKAMEAAFGAKLRGALAKQAP